MDEKKWIVSKVDEEAKNTLAKELGVLPLTASLLINRGFNTVESAKAFLDKENFAFPSPFLMKDMKKGAERIHRAIKNGEKILVYGDYDVDGVTSTTILYQYLKKNGANADFYIPNRIPDGYGLNKRAINEFHSKGGKLIVTVDTGITAIEEVEYASSLGVDTVVTDHHECRGDLPRAAATINPKRPDCEYPFKELAGVGVAFRVLCALETVINGYSEKEALERIFRDYCELCAIGTIADVMPIRDENRIIVSRGLETLENTSNLGLSALMQEAGIDAAGAKKKKLTSTIIGFVIAPRINAAGRIGNAMRAVELFLADNRYTAGIIAAELCATNRQRQIYESEIVEQVMTDIEKNFDFENDLVIVIENDTWHHGVIGIVASKLTEKYNLPSILISFRNEEGEGFSEIGKGSGRSIKGMNLVDALGECEDLLLKFGGHELAAGLSIKRENLPEFKRRINEYARKTITPEMRAKSITVDCEISPDEITLKSASELQLLEPYGLQNPVPLFFAQKMQIKRISYIGDGKHTKLILARDGREITALYFGISQSQFGYLEGDVCDIICNLDINRFRGDSTVQLLIRDIRLSGSIHDSSRENIEKCFKLLAEPDLPIYSYYIPTREDFKMIYKYLKEHIPLGTSARIDIPEIIGDLSEKQKKRFEINKLLIALDIFSEMGLIKRESNAKYMLRPMIFMCEMQNKVVLEDSEILKKLNRRIVK